MIKSTLAHLLLFLTFFQSSANIPNATDIQAINFTANFTSSANASYLIDKHNRKLHNAEIDKINELAPLYAKERGIPQEEAINELILAASINVDRDTIHTPYVWLTTDTKQLNNAFRFLQDKTKDLYLYDDRGEYQPFFSSTQYQYLNPAYDPNDKYSTHKFVATEVGLGILGGGIGTGVSKVLRVGGGSINQISTNAKDLVQYEKYTNNLRRQMERPHTTGTDKKLEKIINENYREKAKIGSGSSAEAYRYEMTTGKQVGGKQHLQKIQDTKTALSKWLKNNPNANNVDKSAAENIIKDINNALKEYPK